MSLSQLQSKTQTNRIHYHKMDLGELHIFYREAGSQEAPTVLLLHGYPTSSHMFRELIPMLSQDYHVIAPDLPGYGYTDAPPREMFDYTFGNLTRAMQLFIDELNLKRFAMYVFDFGAPTGYRLALDNPEKITGIISQNGNAYEEGLGEDWAPIQAYWKNDTKENRDALRDFVTLTGTKFQYFTGVADPTLIAPEAYTLDQHFLDRPEADEIQLDFLKDYETNVDLYPKFQEYFKTYQPKLLAVWGDKDPFFLPPGAEAFTKDIPDAIVKFYDTGHFALETHVKEIGGDILKFLATLPK